MPKLNIIAPMMLAKSDFLQRDVELGCHFDDRRNLLRVKIQLYKISPIVEMTN
jgi:hypothetical protein